LNQHHTIEIFSANCPLCKHITDDIEIGKCEGCNQIVYDVNNMTEEVKVKMKDYGVKAVPTTIIDGKIKIIGIPDFPWICGEDLYKKLVREHSFKNNNTSIT
jgi:glutaredoxin 3